MDLEIVAVVEMDEPEVALVHPYVDEYELDDVQEDPNAYQKYVASCFIASIS